jgi:hypothetical protein
MGDNEAIDECVYIPLNQIMPAIDAGAGDPLSALPDPAEEWMVDQRVYTFAPETVIGYAGDIATGEKMELTAPTRRFALRVTQFRDGFSTGVHAFIPLEQAAAEGLSNWDHLPLERVEPDWQTTLTPVDGSLEEVLRSSGANHTLAVDVAAGWKEAGGDPSYRPLKNPKSFALRK